VASYKQAVVIDKLPKTRSGKIARNTLKAMINNKPFKVLYKIINIGENYWAIFRLILFDNYIYE
jgi:F0F1-type ATP synthase delta subunit